MYLGEKSEIKILQNIYKNLKAKNYYFIHFDSSNEGNEDWFQGRTDADSEFTIGFKTGWSAVLTRYSHKVEDKKEWGYLIKIQTTNLGNKLKLKFAGASIPDHIEADYLWKIFNWLDKEALRKIIKMGKL